ncbi:MAG: hypothetical protein PHF00_11305, partial [Elusimicrobia bacterium]|nr:hypothetical protein [Elusimicrobiota bacterium]
MNRRKMVAYLRKNIPKYGLQAVKDDLVKRQLYAPIEVEAAVREALKPEDPFRQIKIGLAAAGGVFLLATVAMWVFWMRPPAPRPAPSPDMPMPAVRPALAVAPASDPDAAVKSLEEGRAAFKSARLEEALADFDEALRLDPASAPARAER